jgi:polyhydroxyalkanoate synthase
MLGINDILPLHLQLAMMRLFASQNAWSDLNVNSSINWPRFMLQWSEFLPRPKTPLEQWEDVLQEHAREARSDQRSRKQQRQQKHRASQRQEKNADSQANNPFSEFFDHPLFTAALNNEAFVRTQSFIEGTQAVANSDYTRTPSPHRVLWEYGKTRLLDYAPNSTDRVAVLIIPSLINRSYVVDIDPAASFVNYLASQGLRPLLLDWAEPEEESLSYSCADYISAVALPALNAVRAVHDGPLVLAGYCMGGVFAVAMAQLAHRICDGLILLATPWDFSAQDSPRVALSGMTQLALRQTFATMNPIPPTVLNLCFHLIDPWAIQKRYERFSSLADSDRTLFLAVENWLADAVPLSQRVAIESFIDWPQENILHEGKFKIGRSWIEPQAIRCPALAVIPEHDRIVPASCALPLAERLPRCEILTPKLGHVSMMTSIAARAAMWKPLCQWINRHF